MEILEISFKQDFYWSINISRVIRAAVVPALGIGPQIITWLVRYIISWESHLREIVRV